MIKSYILKKQSFSNQIILFDGDCILCSWFVKWIIRNDHHQKIKFCAFQNIEYDPFKENNDYSTVVLIEKGQTFKKSDVTIRVLNSLGGLWHLLLFIQLVPKFLRNRIYDIIARNRYKWFGKEKNCLMMTDDIKARMVNI